MANVPTLGEDYVPFNIDIVTINESKSASKDILNSSQITNGSEDLVQDAIGNGNILEGFD